MWAKEEGGVTVDWCILIVLVYMCLQNYTIFIEIR